MQTQSVRETAGKKCRGRCAKVHGRSRRARSSCQETSRFPPVPGGLRHSPHRSGPGSGRGGRRLPDPETEKESDWGSKALRHRRHTFGWPAMKSLWPSRRPWSCPCTEAPETAGNPFRQGPQGSTGGHERDPGSSQASARTGRFPSSVPTERAPAAPPASARPTECQSPVRLRRRVQSLARPRARQSGAILHFACRFPA